MAETRKRRRLSPSGDLEEVRKAKLNEENAAEPSSTSKPDRDQKQQQRRTLFVRALPPSATTESLTEYFSQSYPIKHATVVIDPKTKQSKGYGFVTFADHEDTQRALEEFNGSDFEGRKLKVEVAEPRHREADKEGENAVLTAGAARLKEEKEKRKLDAQPPKLIIRNLPWSITESEQLAVLFRSYGKVKHATIPKKGSTQAGFGFIVMRGRKNAEKAIEAVNGKEIDGRTLAVDWAVDKNVWEQQKTTEETTDQAAKADGDVKKEDEEAEGDDDNDSQYIVGSDVESDMDEDVSMADADGAGEDQDEEDEPEPEDERNASTVFIRNLPFTATDETLHEHFVQFGPLRYARVVVDPETDRPRGTAFACFWKPEDAISCLREAPKNAGATPSSRDAKDKTPKFVKHSVLQDETQDPSGKYTMEGRVLQVSAAVSRSRATKLEAEGTVRREARDKDKRRLYLLSEGTIASNSPLYAKLSAPEIKMRETSAQQRQKIVKGNPMLHISLTRLSVRNLPRHVDSKALKALAREAVVGFATDVKKGLREPLSKEELNRNPEAMKEAENLRKARGKGIVKQAKVVFEGRDGSKVQEDAGAGRSRGYGFIEYTTHRTALMGLRWLNGHAVTAASGAKTDKEDKNKRLVVEFAIENAQVVQRRQERETQSRLPRDGDGDRKRTSSFGGKWSHQAGSSGPADRNNNRGLKRKRPEGDRKEASAPEVKDSEKSTEKNNQMAKRNRIISKKRMMRKSRKG
ncbi:hypothetical protein AJ80_01281 [Polytolypa hystricis UAMH7299]|uniref:RRM domain-containing protein n=1 Tax=Polytolypa hystricis (strain UAMH7299) TaxID=1447883 RepID=A0A2B7YSS8_POLH7|nr:hypothetical protein AJ80_01281 [Polytolypa hystricis UAMH7299]